MKVPDKSLVCREVEGDMVILNVATGVCYTLKKVGGVVWEGLCRQDDIETIVQKICQEYECDPEEARRDVEELVADLEKEGLLV